MKENDMELYRKTVEHLKKYSPESKVFVLIHKMDTVVQNKERVFEEKKDLIKSTFPSAKIDEFFGTSIWDVTLYNVKILTIKKEANALGME